MSVKEIKKDLRAVINKEKAEFLPRFFKTGPGEYGEGDKFLGVVVPEQRKVARRYYKTMPLDEVRELLASEWHEERLTALFILVLKFQKGDEARRKEVYDLYMQNLLYVNNWDLVDSSAPQIVGEWLCGKDVGVLYRLAESEDLWERRVAMLATYTFIKRAEFEVALDIAEKLVADEHDLIHKAVGWMLREIGKKDQAVEEEFLQKYHKIMPRTMLRYAIEKFAKPVRDRYMGK